MTVFWAALLTASFSMSAVILLLFFLNKLLANKVSALLRYYMWLIVLAGLLIPFRPNISMPFEPIRIPALFETAAASGVADERIQRLQVETPQVSSSETFLIPVADPPFISYHLIMFGAWAVGALGFLVFHLLSYYKFISAVRRWGMEIRNERMLSIMRAAQAHLGLQDRQIDVKTCEFVSSPMLAGFFSPTILLPDKTISEDDLAYVFRHELTHYKRGDLWVNLLVFLVAAMHWFNPFVYLMAKAIRADSEASCDMTVVTGSDAGRRKEYGETIIGFAGAENVRAPILSTYFYGGCNDMKKRLFSIMDTSRKSRLLAAVCAAGIIFITVLSGSTFAAQTGAGRHIGEAIDEAAARQKALDLAGSGSVVLFETKYKKNGGIEYKVTITDGDVVHKVDFYSDGTLKKMTRESVTIISPEAAAYAGNTIGVERAIAIAREKSGGGTVIKCKLDYKKEGLRYEVKIINNGAEHKVKIDAQTGMIYAYNFKPKRVSTRS